MNTLQMHKRCIPRGSFSPALVTASGMDDASLLTTNCLGTPTLPAQDLIINMTFSQKNPFPYLFHFLVTHHKFQTSRLNFKRTTIILGPTD